MWGDWSFHRNTAECNGCVRYGVMMREDDRRERDFELLKNNRFLNGFEIICFVLLFERIE